MYRFIMGLLAVLLAACGPAAPVEGHVTSRSYEDPYVTYVTLCNYTDPKTGVCMMWQDYESHWPECWRLHFNGPNEEGTPEDNSLCVTRGTWDSYAVGDYIDTRALLTDARETKQ